MSSHILRSVMTVSLLSFMQLATQFALQMVLAARFGAGIELDAFNAALVLPTTLNTILTVSLGYVMIPAMASQFASDRQSASAWRLATATGTWVFLIAVVISAGLSFGASYWIHWLYSGFSEETASMAIQSLRILGWQLTLGAISSWLISIDNARSGFLWPALLSLMASIINLSLAYSWLAWGIQGYAWSIIVSGVFQVFAMSLRSIGPLIEHWRWVDPRMSRLALQWLPLLLGGAYVRLDPIVDRMVGSFLPEGNIAQLGYAQRFIQALLTLATGALLTVLFPKLSSATPEDTRRELTSRLRTSLHGMVLVLLPIVLGGTLFAESATRDLLERGEFTSTDTRAVAGMFRVLLWMFAGASIADLMARGFYTLEDTRTPTAIGVIGISMAFMGKFYWTESLGVSAIVWCTSIYFLAVAFVLGGILGRRIGSIIDGRMLSGWLISCLATLMACAAAWTIEFALGRNSTWLAVPLAAAIYGVCLWLFREPLLMRFIGNEAADALRSP